MKGIFGIGIIIFTTTVTGCSNCYPHCATGRIWGNDRYTLHENQLIYVKPTIAQTPLVKKSQAATPNPQNTPAAAENNQTTAVPERTPVQYYRRGPLY